MGVDGDVEDRDRASTARDIESEARDERAELRDANAEARERWTQPPDAAAGSDRAEARRDRQSGARDRAQASDDRDAASVDRSVAASERVANRVDELTGAYRRDASTTELAREITVANRTNRPFVIAFIDVDGLKATNDSGGHAAGDELLRQVVTTLRRHTRPYDVIVRYGGDGFVCGLLHVAARGFRTIREGRRRHPGSPRGLRHNRPGGARPARRTRRPHQASRRCALPDTWTP